jgi:hypothetical protein
MDFDGNTRHGKSGEPNKDMKMCPSFLDGVTYESSQSRAACFEASVEVVDFCGDFTSAFGSLQLEICFEGDYDGEEIILWSSARGGRIGRLLHEHAMFVRWIMEQQSQHRYQVGAIQALPSQFKARVDIIFTVPNEAMHKIRLLAKKLGVEIRQERLLVAGWKT